MFSFEEFQEYVMDHIREYLPEEYANAEVSVKTVQKLNGVTPVSYTHLTLPTIA